MGIVFGAGWASGVGKAAKVQAAGLKITANPSEQTDNDKPDGEPGAVIFPNGENGDEEIIFKFRMPSPDLGIFPKRARRIR